MMNSDAYKVWKSMRSRCNGFISQENYKDVSICEEWDIFLNFEKWFSDNIYEFDGILELDKDLFSKEEKIYSPDTCCFLPKEINTLIASTKSRNQYLPGVTLNQRKKKITYTATVRNGNKEIQKTFKSQVEAFVFYKDEKEKIIKHIANSYKNILPTHIYNALIDFKVAMTCEVLENAVRNKDKMRPESYQEIIDSFQM